MARDYLPASDALFKQWFANFVAQVQNQSNMLGFAQDELDALAAVSDEWELAFNDHQVKRTAAHGATARKRNAKAAALAIVRPYARRIQAHPATTDVVRSTFQLTTPQPRTSGGSTNSETLAQTPLLLLDFGTRGQITVHFGPNPGNENRNGLPSGAIGAVLQVRNGPAADETLVWQWLDNPSASPYVHVVQPTAVKTLAYRCAYLYRRGRKGPWSAAAEAAVTPSA
jgi:hypothetical protein